MQKRENPDQSFMGMDRVIGGPAAKQQALLIHSERSAAKSLGLLASQAASRVDEHETSGAGEPEELTQHRESPRAVVGLKAKECLDVTDIDRGPILFSLFVVQKQREITQRRQRDVDGSVAARQRSRSESPCLGGQHDSVNDTTADCLRRPAASCSESHRARGTSSAAAMRCP